MQNVRAIVRQKLGATEIPDGLLAAHSRQNDHAQTDGTQCDDCDSFSLWWSAHICVTCVTPNAFPA
jgi:hypothetical protein